MRTNWFSWQTTKPSNYSKAFKARHQIQIIELGAAAICGKEADGGSGHLGNCNIRRDAAHHSQVLNPCWRPLSRRKPFPSWIYSRCKYGLCTDCPLIKLLISSFLSPLLLFTSMKMSKGVFRFPNKQQYNNFRVKDIGRYVDLSSITFLTTPTTPRPSW